MNGFILLAHRCSLRRKHHESAMHIILGNGLKPWPTHERERAQAGKTTALSPNPISSAFLLLFGVRKCPHLTHMCAPVGMVSVRIGSTTVGASGNTRVRRAVFRRSLIGLHVSKSNLTRSLIISSRMRSSRWTILLRTVPPIPVHQTCNAPMIVSFPHIQHPGPLWSRGRAWGRNTSTGLSRETHY